MTTGDSGGIRCPRCGRENPLSAQFCMHCGNPLAQRCAVCGAGNPPDVHFCLRCGAPLRGEHAPERRVVSVLFADLVGSTALVQRLDPETTRRLVGEYFAAMREELQRHGGTVEKFIGDAVMAVFGVPAAHEDDPERAVRAALAMQHRMGALNAALGADLRIRIGISTGEVVADPRAREGGEFMVTGDAVNLAARLQQHAPADGIVVDDRTYRATRLVLHYVPLPPAGGGDVAARARWQVTGVAERPPGKGLRAPLVGRDDEMQFLLALYRRVVEGRRHHLVTIIGSAGVGKTRLVEEVLAALRDSTDPPHVLRGRCPAYGEGLTYWPLAEMLKRESGIKDSDPPATAAAKLRARVARFCTPLLGAEESARIAVDLAKILGVEGAQDAEGLQAERRRPRKPAAVGLAAGAREVRQAGDRPAGDVLLRAFRSFLLARAQEHPLVVVFEDLHWAEESLLDLVEHLALRGVEAPVLTLCLARPELLERHPDWGGRIRNYTALSLPPLPQQEGRRLIGALLQGEAVPPGVRDAIVAKAEGNPFFIEEILWMLIDGGSLVRGERGWRLASPSVEIRIPDTIHSILAARLDLLPPLERRVTQDAAVIGRVFWLGALLATGGLNAAEAAAALERLQERELVEERTPSSLVGEREFAFKHALVRDVAYSTLPKAARSDRHLRFARWIQDSATRSAEAFLEVLAYHYEQAWRYRFETGDKAAELAQQAVAALRAAGARALTLRALPEARRLYERALTVVRNAGLEDVVLLLELLTGRSEVVKWMSQSAVLLEDTETVLRLAPTVGRDDLVARAWLNRAFAEYLHDRLGASEEALGRALQLFAGLGDRQGEAEALEVLGRVTEGLRGTLSKAHVAYRKAIALYRQLQDGQGLARTMAHLGRSLLDAGDLEEARRVLCEGLALARQHHERISEAKCLMGLGVLAHLEGDSPTAIRRHEETIALAHELGDAVGAAAVRRHLGMHYLRQGRLDEAEREMRAAYALYREHAPDEPAFILRGLSEVLLARGDLLTAADHAERALGGIPPEDTVGLATYGATLGKVRAAQGRREEAEELFRRSLQVLENSEYRVDLALTLYKHGEALRLLGREEEARQSLERARQLFARMGAAGFVREIGTLLPAVSP